ncbi:hypothetical protein PLESTB_000259000 [Pleodorina starrii]|uniref:Uncharacterized protein n=1 Tax=Pleodorina starrii TaxID=330485 RepID=A0A9W6BCM9_9CHLO|nr:hypothetical protein PLESTB_000259000 [Pleodorina starrii]GLC77276.1 hypothetical protein PLESTF_001907700 [Pleodorina starrii]
MPVARTVPRDNQPGLNLFADWAASEDHFGASTTSHLPANREPFYSTPSQRLPLDNSGNEQPAWVQSTRIQASHSRRFADVSTQTDIEAAPASSPALSPSTPGHGATTTASPRPTAGELLAPAEPLIVSDPRAAASPDTATPSEEPVAGSTEQRTPSEAPIATSAAAGAASAAQANLPSGPLDSPVAASAAVREPSARRPSAQTQRSHSQVVRDSYQLLWREYLALSEQQQQQQQQAAASRRGRLPLTGSSSSSRNNTEMSAPALSTIMQGPLPYDQPKSLGGLLLPLLCPPTDFIDMQKLTKLLVRTVVGVSVWLVTLSFGVIPAWLWLLRHELMQGHKGDAALLLVVGLGILVTADAVRGEAARTDSARCAGIFTASNRSAYQQSIGRTGIISAAAKAAAVRPTGPGSYPAGQTAAAPSGTNPGGGRTPSTPARSHLAATVNGVDPLVSQVKQRIIKLERVLFGNELSEADISRDALSSRVQMLCTELGVPFGEPGSSSAQPSTALLDQQLWAVESALGVL